MGSWGLIANNVANSVFWAPVYVNKTANSTNQTSLSGNVSVGAWLNGSASQLMARGVVGISPGTLNARSANASSEGYWVTHAGWNVRTVGTGYVNSVTITAGGTGYVNNSVVQFTPSGTGVVNAVGTVTTNSTGGITAFTFDPSSKGSGFVSAANATYVAPANAISNSTSGATLAITAAGTGYTNGDIVTFSNGQANAIGTITTNATSNVVSITITRAGRGFSNTLNTVVAVANSTGGASGGSGLTPSFVIGTGSGSTLTAVLGGRAGRRHYECLVAMNGITGPAVVAANNSYLPSS